MGHKPFPPGGDDAGRSEEQLPVLHRDRVALAGLSTPDHGAGVETHEQELMHHEQEQGQLVRGFVHEHSRWLRSLAARFVGRNHADDVAQNAFLSLVTWIRTNPPQDVMSLLRDPTQLRKFMSTLTARRAYDLLRREQRRRDQLTDDGAPREPDAGTVMTGPHAGDIARVERAYAGLSPLQRIAHILYHYYELDHADVATVLEISVTNCRTLVCRANRALKRAMEIEP